MPATAAPGALAPPPGLMVGRFDQPEGYAVQRPRGTHSWLFTWTTGAQGQLRQGSARARAAAARLLESTDLTVERVAAASGFASPFHFNRVFRERYGCRPERTGAGP